MVYQSIDGNELSLVELAQGGHLPSLSWWLNQRLSSYRIHAKLSSVKPGYVRINLEFPARIGQARSESVRNRIVRFLCHQIWILNSDVLDGAYIVASYAGKPGILWKKTVRVTSPARRSVLAEQLAQQSEAAESAATPVQIRQRIQNASKQKQQFQAMRSLLVSGSSAAAFVIGCWLGYADAPLEQTAASAHGSLPTPVRTSGSINTALESIPVIQQKAANSDRAVNLLFGGDVALNNAYVDKVGRDHQWAFSQLEEIRNADISMVNLEAPFTQATQALPGKKFHFKAPPENVQVLQNAGIDLVNLANNHAMDYQNAGLADTLKTLQTAGIQSIGAGTDLKAARRPVIMEVKGKRVAYLGYYDADLHAATAQTGGTNPRHNDRVAADIKALRSQVDWIVVNYHWGEELAKYPGDWQIDLARFTVDQGADLVVGHHPHVLQGAEVYKGRPIVYSLGNFIFGGKAVSDYDTAALKVSLNDAQMKVEFLPVQVRNFQARVVNGQSGQQILSQITNVSDIFQTPMTAAMTLDLKTNQAQSIEPNREQPASPTATPTDAPIQPNAEQPQETEPTNAQPATPPNPAKTPDPENPWSQDSFISAPNGAEKLLKPEEEKSTLPAGMVKPGSTIEGEQAVEVAKASDDSQLDELETSKNRLKIKTQEATVEEIEQESMAPGESFIIPDAIAPGSEAAYDTFINAPEVLPVELPADLKPVSNGESIDAPLPEIKPAQTPESGPTKLEPNKKQYAEEQETPAATVAAIPAAQP